MSPVLENGRLRLRFDDADGRLVELVHDGLRLDLLAERRLAEAWSLNVRLPGGYTSVRASGQQLTVCEVGDGRARLGWRGLATPDGPLDADVTQELELDGDTVTARLRLVNRSQHLVEEAAPLLLGGLANWEEQDEWRLCLPSIIFGGHEWSFYREFPGSYLGFHRPVFAFSYPGSSIDYWQQNLSMPWASLYHPGRRVALYLGNHNPEVEFSAFWGELHPASDHANPAGRNGPQLWPHPSRNAAGVPLGATIGWTFFPLLDGPGEWVSPAVVLHFHEGTWWEAARHYRAWFDGAVGGVAFDRDGLAAVDAWQCTYLDPPDGRVTYRFLDLPQVARAALDAGIEAVMIGGWHEGGLDSAYPFFARPSARLGDAEELRQGIAACRAAGAQVVLWANANQLSVETEAYARELSRYAIRAPDGSPHPPLAFGFDRLLSMMGYTAPRMVGGNLAHPELARLLAEEWERVADFGADAMLVDKVICGEPLHLDFGPDAPGSPTSSAHRALVAAIAELAVALRERSPRVRLALETGWDRMMPFADAIYTRYFGQDHVAVHEAAFPEVKATCCVCGDFDFGLVNNCVRFSHVIAVEGLRIWGTAADLPNLAPYIREVLRLRRSLADNLWHARVVENEVARVRHDGSVKVGALESWSEAPPTGTRHALVVHHFEREPRTVELELAARFGHAVVYRPFAEPEEVAASFSLELPPDRVAAILPLPAS